MEKEVLFERMCRTVREAGDLIRTCTSAGACRTKEGTANFVTKYDSMVQEFLLQRLSLRLLRLFFPRKQLQPYQPVTDMQKRRAFRIGTSYLYRD